MGLHERGGEFAADAGLPLDEFPAGLGFALAFVHVDGEGGNLGDSFIERIDIVVAGRRCGSPELFELQSHDTINVSEASQVDCE